MNANAGNPNFAQWSHLNPIKRQRSGKCSKMCWIISLMCISMFLMATTFSLATFFVTTSVITSMRMYDGNDGVNQINEYISDLNEENGDDTYNDYNDPMTRFNTIFDSMADNEKCKATTEYQPDVLTNDQKVQKLNDYGWQKIGQMLNASCIHKPYGYTTTYEMDEYCLKRLITQILSDDLSQEFVPASPKPVDVDMNENRYDDITETEWSTTTTTTEYVAMSTDSTYDENYDWEKK